MILLANRSINGILHFLVPVILTAVIFLVAFTSSEFGSVFRLDQLAIEVVGSARISLGKPFSDGVPEHFTERLVVRSQFAESTPLLVLATALMLGFIVSLSSLLKRVWSTLSGRSTIQLASATAGILSAVFGWHFLSVCYEYGVVNRIRGSQSLLVDINKELRRLTAAGRHRTSPLLEDTFVTAEGRVALLMGKNIGLQMRRIGLLPVATKHSSNLGDCIAFTIKWRPDLKLVVFSKPFSETEQLTNIDDFPRETLMTASSLVRIGNSIMVVTSR